MIILGVDPGTTLIGFGIIKSDKKSIQCIDYGCIETTPNQKLADKLIEIYDQFNDILKKTQPDIVVIESVFFFKNIKTALKVSEVRGLLMFALKKYDRDMKIIEATPLQIKQMVTGYGRASKMQIQKMVKILLKLKNVPKPDDAADALSAAIYGSNFSK